MTLETLSKQTTGTPISPWQLVFEIQFTTFNEQN